MTPLDSRNELRRRIAACTLCPAGQVLRAPRFALGPCDHPKLMIIGQNPPADLSRAMHGGWLLHYPNQEKGPHEQLLYDLVSYLDLLPSEVYVTQAVKCPTPNNVTPNWSCKETCIGNYLQWEIRDVKPRVILALGVEAQRVFDAQVRLEKQEQGSFFFRTLPPKGNSSDYFSVSWNSGKAISAPHPSVVGRFIERKDWIEAIADAVTAASESTIQWLEPAPYANKGTPPEVSLGTFKGEPV